MEKIIETYEKQIFEKYKKRVIDGNCAFCGRALKNGEYCECKEAKKINRHYKRFNFKINQIRNLFIALENLKDVQKSVISYFTTPPKFEGMEFKDYEIGCESEQKGFNTTFEYYKSAVTNFISGMNLIFLGKFGTGKTMLMSILCNSLANDYLFGCKFVNAVDLMQKITDTFGKTDKTTKGVLDEYKRAEFLFLDDIDKDKPNDYVREIFYGLVNYRTEHELPTIISANYLLKDLSEKYYGEAIVSRLVENAKVINFTHSNRRLK